jgi:hypothetical protein
VLRTCGEWAAVREPTLLACSDGPPYQETAPPPIPPTRLDETASKADPAGAHGTPSPCVAAIKGVLLALCVVALAATLRAKQELGTLDGTGRGELS